jgi:pimeloyl-ACP methyl ester carboxylesterase
MSNTLKVPGATLYYEVRGSGPVLLMIPGGPMDAGGFGPLADAMSDTYTVVTYDCRGNSRSTLDPGVQNLDVDAHADDAHLLVDAVANGGPVYVLGSSGGATYGLDLVARYPDTVRTLVAHEPPLMEILPDADRYRELTKDVVETYNTQGVFPALQKFGEGVGLGGPPPEQGDMPPDAIEAMTRTMGNMELFVSTLIPLISLYKPDIDALRTSKTKVVVGMGDESTPQQLTYRTSYALTEMLGTTPVLFPGDHGGFGAHAPAFAAKLKETLAS